MVVTPLPFFDEILISQMREDAIETHSASQRHAEMTLQLYNRAEQDEPERDFKTALREIAKVHRGTFRLTTNQHLIISDIAEADVPTIKALLAQYKLDNLSYTGLRLSSSACVAFPTCGLAMAESERYLPLLIDKVEKICDLVGITINSKQDRLHCVV